MGIQEIVSFMPAADGSSPAQSIDIAKLLADRDTAMRLLSEAVERVSSAREILEANDIEPPRIGLQHHYRDSLSDMHLGDFMNRCRTHIDRGSWSMLMNRSGLRTFMDAKARKEWDDQLEQGDFPPFDEAHIIGTFRALHATRGEMFERGVVRCFQRLSWCYKTNNPCKLGKRIIRERLLGWYYEENMNELDDLERVMMVLDGKPENDHRNGMFRRMRESGFTYCNRVGVFDSEYMSVRGFKNGNGHITFKRLDLVERMNQIIAKHYPGALPPRV